MVLEESQLYRDLMRFKPDGWTANAWAVRAGVSRTVWTDMRRHGNPSRRTLEKLLNAAGSSLAEFEALRVSEAGSEAGHSAGLADRSATPWSGRSLPPLPLVVASPGGVLDTNPQVELVQIKLGAILDRLPRPISLAGDAGAFVFENVGGTMWPRFRTGRRVAVSPNAQIENGDDVLVTLSAASDGTTLAIVAELAARSEATLELRQFNPAATFRLPTGQFSAVHKIVGELI